MNIIRNVLAVIGFLSLVGGGAGALFLVKSYDLPPRFFTQKVLEKVGLESSALADLVERDPLPPQGVEFPHLGKTAWSGHGSGTGKTLQAVTYDSRGYPVPGAWLHGKDLKEHTEQESGKVVSVGDSRELLAAVSRADAGDVITLAPGTYGIDSYNVQVRNGGTSKQPIVVRAEELGEVSLEMNTLEGFFVDKPYWIFENLDIKGACSSDDRCEHAFHVVGKGKGFVLRNCRLHEFNSIIKANGKVGPEGGRFFPDGALIEGNTFYNSRVRKTGHPVNAIDVVGPNNWIVRDNIIADFAKGQGDRLSYASFIKGNANNGVFENNLVIGEYRHSGGTRVGLSFGGGGSGRQFCRNGSNRIEHSSGIVRNNVVMNFTDVGLYLNKARDTLVLNNIFYRTMGIDVRFAESTAAIENNILAGKIRARDGGTFSRENNLLIGSSGGFLSRGFDDLFAAPEKAYFTLLAGEGIVDKGNRHEELRGDFCGETRAGKPDLGAFEYNNSQSTCTLLDFSSAK